VKILGIPTKIDPSFFVLSFLLATGRGATAALIVEWLLVVFVSVLLHELGHALTARKFGATPSITLYSMGGVTSWSTDTELSSVKRLLISLAGPATGFLFGGIILLIGQMSPPSQKLLVHAYYDLIWVNIGWGIFNLLPMLPLDGGQILVTLEESLLRRKSQIISHAISLLAALSIIYAAASFRLLWIAILGAWFAYSNGSSLIKAIKGRHDRKFESDLELARKAIENKDWERAVNLILRVQKAARSHQVQREAAWLLCFTLVVQNKYEEAQTAIQSFEALHGEEPFLKGFLYFQQQKMAEALPHLRAAFVKEPERQIGTMLVTALTEEGKFAEALEIIKQPQVAEFRWALAINLHNASFQAGDFKVAAEAGALAFESKREPGTAYNVACSFARGGDEVSGLRWLERAVDAGFSDKNLMTTDPDIESLRASPSFDELLLKI
jgi:Zn-dependent protease